MIQEVRKNVMRKLVIGMGLLCLTLPYETIAGELRDGLQAQLDAVMQQTGLTKSEGIRWFQVQEKCILSGYPEFNIAHRCILPIYNQNGWEYPSSLFGASMFATYYKCLKFKDDVSVVNCVGGLAGDSPSGKSIKIKPSGYGRRSNPQ